MAQADIIREDGIEPRGGSASDRRRGQRFMTILRVGKLVSGGAQELCLIRNISAGGLMARVFAPHRIGDKVEIELKSDQRLSGEVVWVREDTVGVRFEGEIEVNDILTHRTDEDGRKARAPRIEVQGSARIKLGDAVHKVEVRDLSQGGVKVELAEALPVGEDVVITIEGMEAVKAVVRWSRDGQAGLSFIRAIPFETLIRWLESRNTAAG